MTTASPIPRIHAMAPSLVGRPAVTLDNMIFYAGPPSKRRHEASPSDDEDTSDLDQPWQQCGQGAATESLDVSGPLPCAEVPPAQHSCDAALDDDLVESTGHFSAVPEPNSPREDLDLLGHGLVAIGDNEASGGETQLMQWSESLAFDNGSIMSPVDGLDINEEAQSPCRALCSSHGDGLAVCRTTAPDPTSLLGRTHLRPAVGEQRTLESAAEPVAHDSSVSSGASESEDHGPSIPRRWRGRMFESESDGRRTLPHMRPRESSAASEGVRRRILRRRDTLRNDASRSSIRRTTPPDESIVSTRPQPKRKRSRVRDDGSVQHRSAGDRPNRQNGCQDGGKAGHSCPTSQAQPHHQLALKRFKKQYGPSSRRPRRSRPAPPPQDPALASRSSDEPRWTVNCIVSKTRINGRLFYKVNWEDTWEPAESLQGCADIAISEFWEKKYARDRSAPIW